MDKRTAEKIQAKENAISDLEILAYQMADHFVANGIDIKGKETRLAAALLASITSAPAIVREIFENAAKAYEQ